MAGVIRPDEVHEVLSRYDESLPIYHAGEGLPGVIIEAYLAGLPVITTNWESVPELVDEKVGIIVEPKCAKKIAKAMLHLSEDIDLFHQLRSNTGKKLNSIRRLIGRTG